MTVEPTVSAHNYGICKILKYGTNFNKTFVNNNNYVNIVYLIV